MADISNWTYSDYAYYRRLRDRQRLAIEYAAHAALPKHEEPRCRGENGMLDQGKVAAWFWRKYPDRAREIVTGIAARSAAAKTLYHRRRAS